VTVDGRRAKSKVVTVEDSMYVIFTTEIDSVREIVIAR